LSSFWIYALQEDITRQFGTNVWCYAFPSPTLSLVKWICSSHVVQVRAFCLRSLLYICNVMCFETWFKAVCMCRTHVYL